MSVWVNNETKLIVQGISGKAARFHTAKMIEYGTNIVAGVTPGRGGEVVEGVNVYETVKEAVTATNANASVIYVPAPYAADAIIEAVDAGLDLVVCITEHIPVHDMILVNEFMKGKSTRLIGPNCPGIITPNQCKIGIMPGHIHQAGQIGIVSRSGTLTYEAVDVITKAGLGQSSAIGIGGDPINGTSFIDCLKAFEADIETTHVVMIGEIGGDAEEQAAVWIKENMTKPVVAFIAGKTAPKGKRMGHAGAIVSGSSGDAESKVLTLEQNGVKVAQTLNDIVPLLGV